MQTIKNTEINFNKIRYSSKYREEVCKYLYSSDHLKNGIYHFLQSQGNLVDAEEVFQEAIVRFFKKVMTDDIEITTSAEQYIFGIAKNIYYSHLKKNKEILIADIPENKIIQDELFSPLPDFNRIINQVLQYTTETCRQVLMYWAENYRMEKIANLMGYKSEMMARKKKHECIKKLSEFLQKNPHIKQNILDHD